MKLAIWLMIFSYKSISNCHFFSLYIAYVITLKDISFSFTYSLFDVRVPRMHNRQLRNNAKLILHLIPYVTTLNSSFRFIEISWLSFLTNIKNSLPIPTVSENKSG